MPGLTDEQLSGRAWLADAYPGIHLAIYRAASMLTDGRDVMSEYIRRLLLQGPEAERPPYNKDTPKDDLHRAMGGLRAILRQGMPTLLERLRHGLQQESTNAPVEVLGLFNSQTMRWLRYGVEGALDLVVLAPATGRLASFTTSEFEAPPEFEKSTVERFTLKNVDYYPFFNKMKPLKGREVTLVPAGHASERRNTISLLKPLLRTLDHARQQGMSRDPAAFVSVATSEALELWSFAACIVKFRALRPVQAAGAGFISQHDAEVTDGSSSVVARFHPGVFREGMEEAAKIEGRKQVAKLADLATWPGWSLIILAWPYGNEHRGAEAKPPNIVKWWPLGSDAEVEPSRCLTSLVSCRKLFAEDFAKKGTNCTALGTRDDVLAHDGAYYFVPHGVEKRYLQAYIENGCELPPPGSIVTLGLDLKEAARQQHALSVHLEANPRLRDQYLSNDPEERLLRHWRRT